MGLCQIGLSTSARSAPPAPLPGAESTAASRASADGPDSLGDRLRAIGAFEDVAIDPRLIPPPPPDHVWPELLIGTGAALVIAGLVGTVVSPTCITRAGDGRCIDARGSAAVWPALVVVGLGATVTGSYWYRWTRLPADE